MRAGHPPVARRAGAVVCLLAALLVACAAAGLTRSAEAAGKDVGPRVAPGIHLGDSGSLRVTGSPPAPATSSQERQPRIIGGTPTTISQAPWQVALTVAPSVAPGNNAQQRQFCGGTLVAPNMVISAAHCVFDQSGTAFQFAPNELSVVSGRTVLSSTEGQELPVANFFVFVDSQGFPLYNPNNGAWDVSIIQLGQASASPPIKMVGAGERALWDFGRRVLVSGWGATKEGGTSSDQLLSAELIMLEDARCVRAFPPGGFDRVTSTCAGVTGGERDACQGDSGGPLVAPTADGGARLVGDVQSGVGCGRLDKPGAYGRFGEEPMQTALRNAGFQVSGGDIAGTGGVPPTDMSALQALELSWVYSENECAKKRKCRTYFAGNCKADGAGVSCRIKNTLKKRKGRRVCSETVHWSSASGQIESDTLKKGCKNRG